ncbi:hypothetical protein P7C73_g6787, partial [Tremellales sp. Uapishka_1]
MSAHVATSTSSSSRPTRFTEEFGDNDAPSTKYVEPEVDRSLPPVPQHSGQVPPGDDSDHSSPDDPSESEGESDSDPPWRHGSDSVGRGNRNGPAGRETGRRRRTIPDAEKGKENDPRPSTWEGCWTSTSRGLKAFTKWRDWRPIFRSLPYLIAICLSGCLVGIALTGPIIGIYFCDVDGRQLGGMGYCNGGSCTTTVMYQVPAIAGYTWIPGWSLPLLLLLFGVVGVIAAAYFAFLLTRYWCDGCCSVPSQSRDEESGTLKSKRLQKQRTVIHFDRALFLAVWATFILSVPLLAWTGAADSTDDMGSDFWIAAIVLSGAWLIVHHLARYDSSSAFIDDVREKATDAGKKMRDRAQGVTGSAGPNGFRDDRRDRRSTNPD